MNGLAFVGPVKVDYHSQPTFNWDGPTGADGLRVLKIGGEFEPKTAEQLSELQANEDAKKTQGSHRGVPVFIWTNNALDLAQYHGAYLLEDVSVGATVDQSAEGLWSVTITAAYLGDDVEYVIPRGAFPKGNDFGLTAKSLVVSPIRPADDAERFVVDPGGTFGTREYDPTYPYDPATPTPTDGTVQIGLYVGTVTDGADDIDAIVFPKVRLGKDVPAWLVDQGGMVRARDRRREREVYGPHFFHESTDLMVTNGLVTCYIGSAGMVPYISVQAVAEGSRREFGVVQLGETVVLTRARLQYVTSELTVVALTIDGYGDALVTLRRGEASLSIESPSGSIRPIWKGTPPTIAASGDLTNGDGHFGNGLAQGPASNLRLRWPADVAEDAWSFSAWLTFADAVVDVGGAGLVTIYDDAGVAAAQVFLDEADNKVKFRIGDSTVASSVQTFAGEDDVLVCARFSVEEGMTLSVQRQDGTVEHVADLAAVDPGTTGRYAEIAFYGREPVVDDLYVDLYEDRYGGDIVWGDGNSGMLRYPDAVVDNAMIFDDRISDTEFEVLGEAATPLGGLPEPEARLRWYAPFDSAPVVTLGAESAGRRIDPVIEFGRQRAVVFLDTAHTESAAVLATSAELDTVAAQHQQLAAESPQEALRARR